MTSVHGFDFFELNFNAEGNSEDAHQFRLLQDRIRSAGVTDVILIAHGFRNDVNDATSLYTRFFQNLRTHIESAEFRSSLASRRYAVAGVYWPSKSFSEGNPASEGSVQGLDSDPAEKGEIEAKLREMQATDAPPAKKKNLDRAIHLLDQVKADPEARDEFVELVLSVIVEHEPDPTEGLQQIQSKKGSELLEALKNPVILPTAGRSDSEGGAAVFTPPVVPDEDGGTQGLDSVFSSVFGSIGKLLNLTTWYTMKNRAGLVGANGVAKATIELKKMSPAPKVHLVGHSLGGRLMAACAKALAGRTERPDSLTLLEAAFSHYGFSKAAGRRPEGFFRAVVGQQVVKGPVVATFSAKDTVVGNVYAVASRLAGDNVRAIGDASDPFGGIGRNGAQQCDEAREQPLHRAGDAYKFTPGGVICLNGSEDLINDHSDITNPHVTYAFASVMAKT